MLEESGLLALLAAFAFGAFEGGDVAAWVLRGGPAGEEVFDGENLEAREISENNARGKCVPLGPRNRGRSPRRPAGRRRGRACYNSVAMLTIAILPEKPGSFRALAGDKESTGRTPGEALDALTTQLEDAEGGTLVVIQSSEADEFFDAAQQQRLGELLEQRKTRSLAADEERELESLVEAELHGARARAEALADAAEPESRITLASPSDYSTAEAAYERRRESYIRVLSREEPSYFEDFETFLAHTDPIIFNYLMAGTLNPVEAEELVQDVFMRIILLRRSLEDIRDVQSYMLPTADRVIQEAEKKGLKEHYARDAERWRQERAEELAENAQKSLETKEVVQQVLLGATEHEKLLFQMVYYEGLSFMEVAVRLGITPQAIRYKISKLNSNVLALLAGRQAERR